jgi:gamma-glutamylaminecyclotransferase
VRVAAEARQRWVLLEARIAGGGTAQVERGAALADDHANVQAIGTKSNAIHTFTVASRRGGFMTTRHRLFVYGTLMKGEHHHEALKEASFVGLSETEPVFEMVQIDYYPALLSGGTTRIIGELYEVDDATLARLDDLEEVPEVFVRERLKLADGSEAFTYVMPRERAANAEPIPSGYFRMRTAPPKKPR